MKTLIVSGLSALLLAVGITPAFAQSTFNPAVATNNSSKVNFTPFALVNLAYQGYLKQAGVPSAGALIAAYNARTITAEALVNKAVAMNLLPSRTLSDQGYLNAVDLQLRALNNNGS